MAPSYTAVLLPNEDGSYRGMIPAIEGVGGQGATRAAALTDVTTNAEIALGEILAGGGEAPREEWPPVRTVWVRNPRRGDTAPYIVMIQRNDEGGYCATAVAFPDVSATSLDPEEAVSHVGPLLFQRLTELVAAGRHFPTQDDPQNYVVRVIPAPNSPSAGPPPLGEGDNAPTSEDGATSAGPAPEGEGVSGLGEG